MATSDFSWLDSDLRREVLDDLARPMPATREPLAYTTPPRHLDRPLVDGKPHLVFVAFYPYPSVTKRALPLRATGGYYLTFLGLCIREDYEIRRWFDQAYEAPDYAALSGMLHRCRAAAVHATIQPGLLGALAADARGAFRLVLDIVDSQLYQEHGADHPAVRLERAILARSDFLAHKLPPEGVARLQAVYGTERPEALLHSLPWPPICHDNLAQPGPPWKIAYAGGVMPYRIAMARGFGHHDFAPVIEAVCQAGMELTFFVNQNARDMHWEAHDRYFDLERAYANFRFRPGLPFHRVPEALSGFHFGLMYDNLHETRFSPEHFRYNMSSKLFTYLEAGLPLLVHDRFDYIVDIVRRHGLGLVYSLDALDRLPELLATADYPALRMAVARFRREHPLEETLPGLRRAFGVEQV